MARLRNSAPGGTTHQSSARLVFALHNKIHFFYLSYSGINVGCNQSRLGKQQEEGGGVETRRMGYTERWMSPMGPDARQVKEGGGISVRACVILVAALPRDSCSPSARARLHVLGAAHL